MSSYKVAQAAQLLGVSDDTVRRLIGAGTLPVTEATPAEVPGAALAEYAVALAGQTADPTGVHSSARNRFVGLVTRVVVDGVMAQVDIQSGQHRVVSLMSAEAVRELQLDVGALAVASVKATNITVEIARSKNA